MRRLFWILVMEIQTLRSIFGRGEETSITSFYWSKRLRILWGQVVFPSWWLEEWLSVWLLWDLSNPSLGDLWPRNNPNTSDAQQSSSKRHPRNWMNESMSLEPLFCIEKGFTSQFGYKSNLPTEELFLLVIQDPNVQETFSMFRIWETTKTSCGRKWTHGKGKVVRFVSLGKDVNVNNRSWMFF